MPPSTVTQSRLENVVICLTMTTNTLQIIADTLQTPFLDAGGELPPEVLSCIGKFTEILHKIYTFVEAQQKGNKVKSFFRQGELSTLLKDKLDYNKALTSFGSVINSIEMPRGLPDLTEMCKDAQKRHQEVLDMIEKLSEVTTSEGASTITGHHSWSSHRSCIVDYQAARHTFVDIADSRHSLEEVDKILFLADNMPLAISLLAHLADTEGCSNVLSHWDKEKTSLISEGFDKRSNLDMSISLSLSSPQIQSIPHSQELLSLLAMLPNGLTDVELIQSKLPLENILKCKTTLKSTALAYGDEHKRLKVLMPIREYLQQYQPPGDDLVQSLFKYFQEMLQFFIDYMGTQSNSSTIPRIKSNLTNIQYVRGLTPGLSREIYLNMTHYHHEVKNDLGGAANMCKKLITLVTQAGNIRRHSHGLTQVDTYESQKLSRISGDLYGEADAVLTQALCWKDLGHYEKSLSLSIRAESLLNLCDMAGSDPSCDMMVAQAEVHRYLYIRENDLPAAKRLFKRCLKLAAENNEIKLFCFERLGNVSSWGTDESTPSWTTIFLIHSLKLKAKLQVYKALQFLRQMFLTHKDENTAISLFTVAPMRFTYMDVHRSRAECMLRLGDISNSHGDLLKAVELWSTLRPLFGHSSQAKEVQGVDKRLACVGSDVLEQHRENIAHLEELNIPSGNPSFIKDKEQVELVDKPLEQVLV
ncbi:hypothetical protein B0H14DRAFT_3605124 [Mycena olivaceomarginata]|nr:hypothetical protein B0H14DRAFT_3605124 [Mycena olivaceomarginata]